jgi:hypothetical protein
MTATGLDGRIFRDQACLYTNTIWNTWKEKGIEKLSLTREQQDNILGEENA